MTEIVVDNHLIVQDFDSTNIDIIEYRRRPLLVLDLDETLIKSFSDPLEHPFDFFVCDMYVYKRPFLEYFLKTVSIKYDIAIWSAGGSEYVKQVVEHIIPKNVYVQFVYSKNQCEYSLINETLQLIKPLSKIYKYNYDNMIIIDDNGDLTRENHQHCIIPEKYNGTQYDCELINILYYLDYILAYPDFKVMPHREWRQIVDLVINQIDISVLNEF